MLEALSSVCCVCVGMCVGVWCVGVGMCMRVCVAKWEAPCVSLSLPVSALPLFSGMSADMVLTFQL